MKTSAKINTNTPVTKMLYFTVIIALFASLSLSVDAIRCHQCNSHLDEDCLNLRLATPGARRDDQYLRECEGDDTALAFCRKTVVTLEATKEHRVIRSCGWLAADFHGKNSTCFDADNEGYFQVICACHEDGCNSAPGIESSPLKVLSATAVLIFIATWLRQSA